VGDGKTAVLVRLVELLYDKGAVPVPVALREAKTKLDFKELARNQFLKRIGPSILSEDEGDKVWRELCSRRLIVVLADGLDEALLDASVSEDERPLLIQTALENAADDNLPLVITSRPERGLERLDAAIIPLEPLPAHRVVDYIAKAPLAEAAASGDVEALAAAMGPAVAADRTQIERVCRTAEVMERPLYLKLARVLNAKGRLAGITSTTRVEARLELLDTWRSMLVDGELEGHVPMDLDDRKAAVETAEEMACVALACNTLAIPFSDAAESPYTSFGSDGLTETKRLADQARRLDIVETVTGGVRFRHSILQAYLGAKRMPDVVNGHGSSDAGYVADALSKPGRELTMALVMFCLIDGDRARAAELRRKLCARALSAMDSDGERHLGFELLAAAYEIHPLADSAGGQILPATAIELWRAESGRKVDVETTEAKLRTIGPIAEAGTGRGAAPDENRDPAAMKALWEICRLDDQYAVRFQAAQALAAGGTVALEALRGNVEAIEPAAGETLAYGEAGVPAPDWADVRRFSVLAWILPGLYASVSADDTELVHDAIEALVNVAVGDAETPGPRLHLGIEAALAQGFKWEANRIPGDGDRKRREFLVDQALLLLDASEWWQTDMALLQALALWALDRDAPRRGDVVKAVRAHRGRDTHPFVRATADLCVAALPSATPRPAVRESARLRGPSRHIWIDDAGVAGKIGPTDLPSDEVTGLWIPPAAGWSTLDGSAQQLAGDTLVYLNLIEDVDDAAYGALAGPERTERTTRREKRRERVYARGAELPPCITSPLRRTTAMAVTRIHELNGSEDTTCGECEFKLCPYPQRQKPPFRGELPATFCRAQARAAGDEKLPAWADGLSIPFVRKAALKSLEGFWRHMEQRDRRI
jgi:hypothetical protein